MYQMHFRIFSKSQAIRFYLLLLVLLSNSYLQVLYAQENQKGVVITVSGTGQSREEALSNALRSAIESVFGAFISSKTEIVNDDLIKDEIISIASGNIENYKVISEIKLSDNSYTNTVTATVSVSNLTTFCENKGVKVEFKGSLFALNMKQQLLNEQNETKVVENMLEVLKETLNRSLDYSIKTRDPSVAKDRFNEEIPDTWLIQIDVNAKWNSNVSMINEYFLNTLTGISLTESEIENNKKFKKTDYPIHLIKNLRKRKITTVSLRNESSLQAIGDFLFSFQNSILSFTISNGVSNIYGSSLSTENSTVKDFGENSLIYCQYFESWNGNKTPEWLVVNQGYFGTRKEFLAHRKFRLTGVGMELLQKDANVVNISFYDKRTLSEINKISGYIIRPN